MCLYGNRKDILTEYNGSRKTQQGLGVEDGAWYEAAIHQNCLQLTLLLYDPYTSRQNTPIITALH